MMKISLKTSFFLGGLCLAALTTHSCSLQPTLQPLSPEVTYQPRAGEYILRESEGISLQDAGLRIAFQEVLQDSRCPKDVQCTWIGNARVALDINGKQLTLDTQNLPSNGMENRKEYQGYRYTLIKLYPEHQAKPKKDYYTVVLKIEKPPYEH